MYADVHIPDSNWHNFRFLTDWYPVSYVLLNEEVGIPHKIGLRRQKYESARVLHHYAMLHSIILKKCDHMQILFLRQINLSQQNEIWQKYFWWDVTHFGCAKVVNYGVPGVTFVVAGIHPIGFELEQGFAPLTSEESFKIWFQPERLELLLSHLPIPSRSSVLRYCNRLGCLFCTPF